MWNLTWDFIAGHWMLIILTIVVIVWLFTSNLGRHCLCSFIANNNNWALALFLIAVGLTISACCHGFGRPLLYVYQPTTVYPSWWHFGAAAIAWLVFLISLPICFFDEAVEAGRRVRAKFHNTTSSSGGGKKGAAQQTATVVSQSATGNHGGWTFQKDLFAEFLGEFGTAIFMKIITGRVGGM
jgi:hypothetical protein